VLTEQEVLEVRAAISRLGYMTATDVRARHVDDRELDRDLDLLARAVVESTSAWIRWNACSVLDHHGDDRHTWALLLAADDPVPRVRQHAVHALSCTACKRDDLCVDAVPVLVRALHDQSAKVRRHAAYGLEARADDPRAAAALAATTATATASEC
jgi:HEAT repeat protein